MKVRFKQAMLAFAVLVLGVTSCTNEEAPVSQNPLTDGEKGSLSISFTTSDLQSRAINATQTSAESTVATAQVFVFRPNGVLEAVGNYTLGTDMTGTSGTYSSNAANPMENLVAEAGKKVYIGVNMPASLVSAIQTSASGGANPLTTPYTAATLAQLTASNSFTMFSNPVTVTVSAGTTVNASATVSRLAAKATVVFDNTKITGSDIVVAGGKIPVTSLKWAVDNGNSNFFLLPQVNGRTEFTSTNPSPMVFNWQQISGDNPGGSPAAAANSAYMMENYPATPDLTNGSNITFIRVQATFIPSDLVSGSAGAWTSTPSTWTSGTDFWIVPNQDGTIAYFASEATATTYEADASSNAIHPGSGTNVKKYPTGQTEYGIFITKDAGKFNIIRNNYYIVTVSGINGLGLPGGATNPPIVIPPTSKGSLSFDFTVNDWIPEKSSENLQ